MNIVTQIAFDSNPKLESVFQRLGRQRPAASRSGRDVRAATGVAA